MKRYTVLSMEQALSLPSATLRFAQLGWRVIRIESFVPGDARAGDPNRYIGSEVVDDDRRSYFVAPNVGKEAIALNLRTTEGRSLLPRLLRSLFVDVFCCNTLPRRYETLGIDYPTLAAAKPDLIWAGISALGPDYPDVPGYDPVLQAMAKAVLDRVGVRLGTLPPEAIPTDVPSDPSTNPYFSREAVPDSVMLRGFAEGTGPAGTPP